MRQTSSIQVIARAAAILRLCRAAGGGLSLGDIAVALSLPRSTVQRIVRALADEGLLSAGRAAGTIRLGTGIEALADAARIDVPALARPILTALALELGETVDLAVLQGGHMVFTDQIAGSQRLRAVSAVGETFPLHCTANGKAALAAMSPAAAQAILPAKLQAYTPQTVIARGKLIAEIARVRQSGIATDRQEHSPGICAIGAALTDCRGAIHAVSVPMPSVRFEAIRPAAEIALRKTIMQLSLVVGSA